MARKRISTNEAALKIIEAGIVVVDGDDLRLFSWQSVIERLGDAGCDLSFHIEWGRDFREDVLDWAETLTFQNEIGTMTHALREDGVDKGEARCVVEFEDDRIRLYYEGEDGVEAGITTIHFEKGDFLNPVAADFLPFGAKKLVPAEAVWFSGSLAL